MNNNRIYYALFFIYISYKQRFVKGAVSRNSAKLGNDKMAVKLRETKMTA